MLDKKRIEEARNNANRYLTEKLITKVDFINPSIKQILLNNCYESLRVAELLNNGNHSNLWTIVSSYYSMYYIANAVLYEIGYKVGEQISHKVTSDALIAYAMQKLKQSLLEDYEEAKAEALEISGNKANEIMENLSKDIRIQEGI